MTKYKYHFVAGDFDMREQTFSRTFDEEQSEETLNNIVEATKKINPSIAYCECYEKEVVLA